MKTRINLYLAELRPKKDPLSLNRVTVFLLTLLLVMVLLSSVLKTKVVAQQKMLQNQQQLVAEQQATLTELQTALARKQDKNVLSQQLAQIKAEIQHKQLVMEFISTHEQTILYAEVMEDLARLHDPLIWLTGFKFNNQHIILEGQTDEPAQIPHWLDGLKASSYFSGKLLSEMKFEQRDGVTYFRVASEPVMEAK
ncbi:PilN domain-containing protein [Pseudoalteromonas tunicata]|uniref:Putative Mannose-sensitive agglutinin (MSHA) biogenesis protein MshI (Pilus type IV) with frame shift n=1 Tax=Pseudoalteromonas tunicata D2 TaxID=87626 RepID=A4C7Y3_9GAMM|nr:PilN domain-containing protein [Pseudoalteromonas tunicata]ATC93205.1 hypothetical protein PTUN_a0407 [Pseudoalteromonas tunicata]AXT32268.1 hypothetical protein D1819_16510 [Pseudoalteromonas tunicata]EAR28698.1 putative Mannose-sensitive agglutinin (MSHA) biogenesis protein MshI (pilus type IV) with frame shift [Pseudoalteromonas tunicata D2]MDP4983984.1 PilN domain-containing protein [Pseudoalteromonas tunicata]